MFIMEPKYQRFFTFDYLHFDSLEMETHGNKIIYYANKIEQHIEDMGWDFGISKYNTRRIHKM